jgi:hypothetical protein
MWCPAGVNRVVVRKARARALSGSDTYRLVLVLLLVLCPVLPDPSTSTSTRIAVGGPQAAFNEQKVTRTTKKKPMFGLLTLCCLRWLLFIRLRHGVSAA